MRLITLGLDLSFVVQQSWHPSSTEIGQLNITSVRDMANRLRIVNESDRAKPAKFEAYRGGAQEEGECCRLAL
jgi:hypothetical protein